MVIVWLIVLLLYNMISFGVLCIVIVCLAVACEWLLVWGLVFGLGGLVVALLLVVVLNAGLVWWLFVCVGLGFFGFGEFGLGLIACCYK